MRERSGLEEILPRRIPCSVGRPAFARIRMRGPSRKLPGQWRAGRESGAVSRMNHGERNYFCSCFSDRVAILPESIQSIWPTNVEMRFLPFCPTLSIRLEKVRIFCRCDGLRFGLCRACGRFLLLRLLPLAAEAFDGWAVTSETATQNRSSADEESKRTPA